MRRVNHEFFASSADPILALHCSLFCTILFCHEAKQRWACWCDRLRLVVLACGHVDLFMATSRYPDRFIRSSCSCRVYITGRSGLCRDIF